MNEITYILTDCTAGNASVFTLNMYSLKFNPFADILMTVWVLWYEKN